MINGFVHASFYSEADADQWLLDNGYFERPGEIQLEKTRLFHTSESQTETKVVGTVDKLPGSL